ncbi:PAS domain S-box protein [bacterium]|nr:PAS domain S-box protein [bacterium]
MDIFKLLTPVTYWILIVVWSYILSFYLIRLRSGKIKTGLTVTLLIILSIEAFRTLFESIYFGAWYTSLQGMLPGGVHAFLIRPDMVFIPKLLNVFAAFVIIVILIRRWIPQEQAYGRETDRIIEKQTQELIEKNRLLNLEMVRRETIEKQLKEHRDHLEDIVEKRTEQLERSNEQLKKEIEERHLIKTSLDKTYTELDQIFNHAAIGIRVVGQDHRVIRVNDRLLAMTGLERSEIMAKHCHELFTGPDCQTDRCTLRRIEANSGPYELEIEKVDKDGRTVPYLLTATPYFDTGGNRIGVIESFLDISNRKKIEKAFKDERDLFMDGVVVVFRWRNTENWPVDYVSPNVQKILGYRPEEFLNEQLHYKDLIDEQDLDRVYRRKMAPAKEGIDSLEHAPYRLRHKNGNLVWILDYTRFVRNQAGEVEFLHGYIIDISQYKATEEKLENQAQLAHTGRLTALGEMASGMAHELNQPMTVIRLAADGLKMYFAQNPSDSTESESVDDIITQVKRATKIIKNMRSFSHPKSQFVQEVDIREPLEDALSFFKEQFRIHQISVNLSIAPDLPRVAVDPQKFEQIVVNLLTNARYAIEKKNEYAGSDYAMEVDIRLDLSKNRDFVIFQIRDNGIGMSPKIVQRCMEPFYTTKDIGEGTGLGLSIIHGIVKEFDMQIEITSEEEEFCQVTIHIPVKKPRIP